MANHSPTYVENTVDNKLLWRCAKCGLESTFLLSEGADYSNLFEQEHVAICTENQPLEIILRPAITKKQFLDKFTYQEIAGIKFSQDPIVQVFMYKFDMSTEIVLDEPEVAQGLAYLASIGLLAAERPAEILA